MKIVSAKAWRSLTCAALSAFLLAGCATEPESTDSTAPPARPVAPSAGADAATPAIVTGEVPTIVGGGPSLVMLSPADGRELPLSAATPIMDQVQLAFIPDLLFVRTDQMTEFRNSDPELHNIRVFEEATKDGIFNVAIPTGETYEHTFRRDGFYDVSCDIHNGMAAMIVATSTPFTAVADSTGHFTIYDVPPGAYVATIHVGGRQFERSVHVTGRRTALDLKEAPPPES